MVLNNILIGILKVIKRVIDIPRLKSVTSSITSIEAITRSNNKITNIRLVV